MQEVDMEVVDMGAGEEGEVGEGGERIALLVDL